MFEGEGEHEHNDTPPVIAPVIDAGNELVAPVIDHAEKITHLEERQSQQEEAFYRRLSELQQELTTATGSQVAAIEERMAGIERKLEEMATPPAEAIEDVPDEAVEFAEPEVESSPAPPEKVRKGLRHRRKARRGK
jgi:hypothetical protein